MALSPSEGLKLCSTLQWHLSEERRRQAHPEAQPSKRLSQVSLQSLSRLLQRDDLSLQGAKPLGQGQQRGRERRLLVSNEGRRLLWEGSQAALMQASESLQVLTAHPFFAAILGTALQGELRIR